MYRQSSYADGLHFRGAGGKLAIHWRTPKCQYIGPIFLGLLFLQRGKYWFPVFKLDARVLHWIKKEDEIQFSFGQGSSHLCPSIIYITYI